MQEFKLISILSLREPHEQTSAVELLEQDNRSYLVELPSW
jgi:hypothetical protein